MGSGQLMYIEIFAARGFESGMTTAIPCRDTILHKDRALEGHLIRVLIAVGRAHEYEQSNALSYQ